MSVVFWIGVCALVVIHTASAYVIGYRRGYTVASLRALNQILDHNVKAARR